MEIKKPQPTIEQIKVDDLIPYATNSRTHSAEQVSQIAASMVEFGWTNPVLIDTRGTIVAGHGRVMAARKLGMETVPCIRLAHLSPAQVRAYVIADNKLALNAGWDDAMLKAEFEILKEEGFDIGLTGFSEEELADLLEVQVVEGSTDPDEIPETPDEPVTKSGDLYILGNHKLLCGDSTSHDDVDRLMSDEKADMVFTDPPYNIDYGNIKHPKLKQRSIENDNMSQIDFRSFVQKFAEHIKRKCKGIIYVFGPPGVDGRIMFTVFDEMFHCSTTIVWNKDQFTLGRGKYQNKYEPCWFGWNDSGSTFTDDRTLTNVWDFPRPKRSDLHPTMKPVGLVEIAINHASKPGDIVFDLFGGSGTTLIASEKTGRQSRLMELDPKYCDVIVKRWEDFTGKKAVLESDLC